MPTALSCQTNSVLIKWFIIHWRYGTHIYPYSVWRDLKRISFKYMLKELHCTLPYRYECHCIETNNGNFSVMLWFPIFCISFSPNMCELWDFESPRHVHLVKVETCGAHICFFPPGPIVKATHNWTLPSRHREAVVLHGWHSLVFFVTCSSISMFNSASSCDKNRHLSL